MPHMMRWAFRRISVMAMVSVVMLSTARIASAQCDGGKPRPATAAEAKIYAEGLAMFERMAPAAPPGWTAVDDRTVRELKDVCGSEPILRWSFMRTFNRTVDPQAASDKAVAQTQAVMARAEERRRANATKLADIEKRQAELGKRLGELAAAGRVSELAALSPQMDKLTAEREALSNDPQADAEMTAIGAEIERDTTASFNLIVGNTDAQPGGGFKPVASTVGKAYRQDYNGKGGNPESDLVVVLPPAVGSSAPTVVRISGDPARVDGLAKAAKLR